MQPPLVKAHLKDQIALLKEKASVNTFKSLERIKTISLEDVIKDWLSGLTGPQLSHMYGIAEIIKLAQLKGKYREFPAKQMVAIALYKLGFRQLRSWKKEMRNRRYWILKK
ncbi:hypothetical protein G6722_07730 [Polynucleobacter paneuropaeus]|nr:hypothetical protein [Polynucleobacter paneuropaeus]